MAGLPNSSNALQQWHHLFEAQGGPRTPEASQHLQQLLRLGLPTRKHEDWKYTPLDALLNGRFVAVEGASLSAEQRDALALPLDAWRLVFIDGRYHPELSDDLAASGVSLLRGAPPLFSPAGRGEDGARAPRYSVMRWPAPFWYMNCARTPVSPGSKRPPTSS